VRDYPAREANEAARRAWVAKKRTHAAVFRALKTFDSRRYDEATGREVRDAVVNAVAQIEGVIGVDLVRPSVTFNPQTRGFDVVFGETEEINVTVTV
jgi:hypothetical protein